VNASSAGGPADDFAISIEWFGESDKPPREALLASPARAASIAAEPLVAIATITRREFDAAVAAIRSRGLALRDGRPAMDLDAYAAVVDDGGAVHHAALGFDAGTAGHLEAIAAALEPDHRGPVDAVLDQVRALVGG